MEFMRGSRLGLDSSLDLIAERLRADNSHVTQTALPARWVDLIHELNERERMDETRAAALNEVLRTDEPTPEAKAKVEDLRRKVAQALGEGDKGSS